jgi:phospholipase C
MGGGSHYTRRAVLSAAAAGSGGVLLSAAVPAWAKRKSVLPAAQRHSRPHRRRVDELPYPDREMGESGIPQIEYLVLVMMENHSTDNILGLLPTVSPAHRWSFDGLPLDNTGKPIAWNPDKTGNRVYSYPLADMCPFQGLGQDWNATHVQWDNGKMDGFVENAGYKTPMSYFTPEQLPISYAVASNYAISDRHFCSVMGQTLPNRRFYFSGTSSGYVNDDDASIFVDAANGTIFDRLSAAKISFMDYANGDPTPDFFPSFRDRYQIYCTGQQQFFADAAAGKLPTVSVVEANGNWETEENPQDVAYGENFVANVVDACQKSPLWPKMALFITYDEHGGYYDHVAPPAAVAPDDIAPILTSGDGGASAKGGFDRYGFRVPFMVVSPWAQPDAYVSHQVTDHTSVLAFIESWRNLAPMTKRDAAAWDLRDMFDVSQPNFADGITLPTPPSISGTLAQCKADGEDPPTSSDPEPDV